jgi:hypothetical protein
MGDQGDICNSFCFGSVSTSHFQFLVMAIHISSYRISSDLRSQSDVGAVSTGVGDHLGILRAITFACCFSILAVFLLIWVSFVVVKSRFTTILSLVFFSFEK